MAGWASSKSSGSGFRGSLLGGGGDMSARRKPRPSGEPVQSIMRMEGTSFSTSMEVLEPAAETEKTPNRSSSRISLGSRSRSNLSHATPRSESSLSQRVTTPTKHVSLTAVKRKEETETPIQPELDWREFTRSKSNSSLKLGGRSHSNTFSLTETVEDGAAADPEDTLDMFTGSESSSLYRDENTEKETTSQMQAMTLHGKDHIEITEEKENSEEAPQVQAMPRAPSPLLATPRAPSALQATPRAPSPLQATPRAPSPLQATPKATSQATSQLQATPQAAFQVKATPQVTSQVKAMPHSSKKQPQGAAKKESSDDDDDDDDDDSDSDEGPRKVPTELLMEFLDCLMKKEYKTAEKLCRMILIYDPTHAEALMFHPVIMEKIQLDIEAAEAGEDNESDDDDDDDDDDDSEEDSSLENDSSDNDDNDDDNDNENQAEGEEEATPGRPDSGIGM